MREDTVIFREQLKGPQHFT